MPCSVWTLKPCLWGRCTAQPQASSWEPRDSKANCQLTSYAPLTAGPNFPLSQRYGPAIIPWELVAENGLFQPKLTLAQKSPNLTPCPDPPEVRTRQLTLRPSSTNSLEPSPNLVPSEVPASGHHGVTQPITDPNTVLI